MLISKGVTENYAYASDYTMLGKMLKSKKTVILKGWENTRLLQELGIVNFNLGCEVAY